MLAWYYEGCVIGGPDSFVVAISDPAGFEKALHLKLMREIAGLSPRISNRCLSRRLFAELLRDRPAGRTVNSQERCEAGTSISAGILLAAKLFETTALQADRKTVDVSGDGPNNAGPPIKPVSDALIARGVIINGLAISLPHNAAHRLDSFGPHYILRRVML